MLSGYKSYQKTGLLLVLLLLSCAHYDDSSPSRLLMQANMAAFDRQYEEALDLLQEATRMDPDYVQAWMSKGMVYRRLQNDELARKCYEVAQLLYYKKHLAAPDNIDFIKGYAESLSLLGRKDEAMTFLDQSIFRLPGEQSLVYFKEMLRQFNSPGFDQHTGTDKK